MRGKRLAILTTVQSSPATARQVADTTGFTFPQVCADLSYLYHAGFLTRTRVPRRGPGRPENVYASALAGRCEPRNT